MQPITILLWCLKVILYYLGIGVAFFLAAAIVIKAAAAFLNVGHPPAEHGPY